MILQQYKNKANTATTNNSYNINENNSLKPWDINYYTSVKQASANNGVDSKSLALISEYLPLDLVLKGNISYITNIIVIIIDYYSF
jgi:Zn-dependent oligopeptidase